MSPFIVLGIGVVFIVSAVAYFKIHPFFALLLAAILVGILSAKDLREEPGETVRVWQTASFGETLGEKGEPLTFRASPGDVRALCYSADEALLAVASASGVRIWDAASGREIQRVSIDGASLLDAAFSPSDDTLALAGGGGEVWLWRFENDEKPVELDGHSGPVRAVAFAGDGRLASGGDGGTLRLWDVSQRKEVLAVAVAGGGIRSLAFAPRGDEVVTGSEDGVIRLWRPAAAEPARILEGHTKPIHALVFSGDGKWLASGAGDRTIRLWEPGTNNEPKVLRGHGGMVLSLSFDPEGSRLASASSDGTVRLWETATGKEVQKLGGDQKLPAVTVAYHPEGTQLAAGYQDTLDPQPQAKLALNLTARAFGRLAGGIGIVIALAAVIGHCLMESGAADKITRRFLAFLGEKRANVALLGSGYVLSVPVFFDTVFFLLVPLARALRMRTGRNFVLYVMAICAGGALTHSLVPPTPGPLVMVENIEGLDLGSAILGGFLLGLPVAMFGGIYLARYMNRKLDLPLRDAPGSTQEELEAIVHRREDELPGFLISIAPVLLPVVLISAHSIVDALRKTAADPQAYAPVFSVTAFLGDKLFALGLGTAIALWTLARQKRYSLGKLTESLEPALFAAGVIILITCAGGAFGDMLKRTGIGDEINRYVGDGGSAGMLLVLLAWGVAAVMKIAQGSGTVAMITASAIMASLLQEGVELPYHPIYIFAAIAYGSMFISWMNDSGFWVVCKMSGFTQEETLKTWTVQLGAMAILGLAEVLVVSSILPLK